MGITLLTKKMTEIKHKNISKVVQCREDVPTMDNSQKVLAKKSTEQKLVTQKPFTRK